MVLVLDLAGAGDILANYQYHQVQVYKVGVLIGLHDQRQHNTTAQKEEKSLGLEFGHIEIYPKQDKNIPQRVRQQADNHSKKQYKYAFHFLVRLFLLSQPSRKYSPALCHLFFTILSIIRMRITVDIEQYKHDDKSDNNGIVGCRDIKWSLTNLYDILWIYVRNVEIAGDKYTTSYMIECRKYIKNFETSQNCPSHTKWFIVGNHAKAVHEERLGIDHDLCHQGSPTFIMYYLVPIDQEVDAHVQTISMQGQIYTQYWLDLPPEYQIHTPTINQQPSPINPNNRRFHNKIPHQYHLNNPQHHMPVDDAGQLEQKHEENNGSDPIINNKECIYQCEYNIAYPFLIG